MLAIAIRGVCIELRRCRFRSTVVHGDCQSVDRSGIGTIIAEQILPTDVQTDDQASEYLADIIVIDHLLSSALQILVGVAVVAGMVDDDSVAAFGSNFEGEKNILLQREECGG